MYAEQPADPIRMTEAAYLAFADAQDEKHEFENGVVYNLSGASVRHNIITVNVSTQLNLQLADRDCTVTSPDTRVHIASRSAYRYPDVTVFCGAAAFLDGRADTITNPFLLVEVLSPGTQLRDRNNKLTEYTQIASLQAYLLVSQEEAKIERFLRHESDQWLYQTVTGFDAQIEVLGCTLALAEVYRKVPWDDAETS